MAIGWSCYMLCTTSYGMNPTKNYIAAGMLGLACFIALGFAWPGFSSISDLRTAVKERQKVVDDSKIILSNIDNLKREYENRQADVNRASSLIPVKKSNAEIVSTLQDISTKTGLQLTNLSTSNASEDANLSYNRLLIDMDLTGNYPSLTLFIQNLEKNLRLIDVSLVQASQAQNTLSFKVKATAYYLK